MALSTNLAAFLYPCLCENAERGEEIPPCEKEAKMTCKSCHIVQYCSRECQAENWKLHKRTCKGEHLKESWKPRFDVENRLPTFMNSNDSSGFGLSTFGSIQYLWGNVPAVDILNIDQNEGKEDIMRRDIALLFAASGDLRNVVKTLARLPKNYAGECVVVVNDWNFCVTARNIIMLLVAMHFDAETAVPIIMHVWYSALLPEPIIRALQDSILPFVEDVCQSISAKDGESLQAKTFKFENHSMRVVLRKREWVELAEMFKPPEGLSADAAKETRDTIMLAPSRVDYVDKELQKMSPAQRTGSWKFRTEGILLPYGTSRKCFTIPNPTLFTEKRTWPMKDDANPLSGWSYNEYMACSTSAKNDIYGAFFVFLRNILLQFCKRVQTTRINFHLFTVDAVKLPEYLNQTTFDRIEVSNICDRGYVGVDRILQTFSPMLKTKAKNPYATLLMLFFNAVRDVESEQAPDMNNVNQLRRFMPDVNTSIFDVLQGQASMAEFVKASSAMYMFGDFDGFFNKFLARPDPYKAGSMDTLTRAHGMKVKVQHSIIEPWPFRVTDSTTKAKFQIMLSESTSGHERYMEFEKSY